MRPNSTTFEKDNRPNRKMEIQTHDCVDPGLCGHAVDIARGFCRVEFTATPEMQADGKGLVHGGFIFGLADYAAMLAVNHPNVVLGAAHVTFHKPVKVGDRLTAEANQRESVEKKRVVTVSVRRGTHEIFQGTFTCFILAKHVLAD